METTSGNAMRVAEIHRDNDDDNDDDDDDEDDDDDDDDACWIKNQRASLANHHLISNSRSWNNC